MEVKEIYDINIFKLIISELRKEYGVKRKGDTYMPEEKLLEHYNKFTNKELNVAVAIDINKQVLGFVSYQVTPDGLYGSNILVFPDHRGKGVGKFLSNYMDNYAQTNNCKQIYFGARRSANAFHYKNGYEGTCLIQSSFATKEDIDKILNDFNINNYSYNLYQNSVHQFRIDARYIENKAFVETIDNSNLDIGCILTFTKQIPEKILEKWFYNWC